MNQTLGILFYLKNSKELANGEVPIYLRITVDGKRAEHSIQRSIHPDNWSGKGGRATGNKEKFKSLNVYLDTIRGKIYDQQKIMLEKNELITAESIKNGYLGISVKTYTDFASPAVLCSDSAISFVYDRVHTNSAIPDTIQRVDMVLSGTAVQPSQPVFKMQEDSGAGYLNYFLGFVPNGVPKVEGYSRLVYKNVYPNTDMQIYSNTFGTKIYFICNPGSGTGISAGNPANIEIKFKGANSVAINSDSGITVATDLGNISFASGYAYEDSAGHIVPTNWHAHFEAVNSNTVKFHTASYNTNEPLIIEVDRGHNSSSNPPIDNLNWCTYFEGDGPNNAAGGFNAVTLDASNNVYTVGNTTSTQGYFPVINGKQRYNGGEDDILAAKFNSHDSLVWVTFYGGEYDDYGAGIGLDKSGNVFLGGYTFSPNFPEPLVQPVGAYVQPLLDGGGYQSNACIVKLSSNGDTAKWATYFGGSGNELGENLVTDVPHNYVYLIGVGAGTNTPLKSEAGAYNNTNPGGGFLLKFTNNGVWKWGTTIGTGTVGDATQMRGCTVDGSGNFLIAGYVGSTGYPVTAGNFSLTGNDDIIATKFDTSNSIVWSTYYGGGYIEYGGTITTDLSGNAYITGLTYSDSANTPIQLKPDGSAYYQTNSRDGANGTGFLAELAASTGNLLWGTYFGGQGFMSGGGLVVDANNYIYLGGTVDSNALIFPHTQPANAYVVQNYVGSNFFNESYLSVFNASKEYYWGTYFGDGKGIGGLGQLALSSNSNIYWVGNSGSYPDIWANPGGGAWFNNSNFAPAIQIPYIAEFGLSGVTGVDNITTVGKNEIKVYPNPTSGNVNVELNIQESQEVEFILYNLFGQPVYSQKNREYAGLITKQISLSSLPNGNYILQVIAGNSIYHAKIAKLQ